LSDRPDCSWRPDLPGDVCIGCRGSGRDPLQRFPNKPLEGGPSNVEGQIQSGAWFLDKAGHLRD
jgi:hypothetical protein